MFSIPKPSPISLFLVVCLNCIVYQNSAQSGPGCDSLYVDSILFNPQNVNQLQVYVRNANTDEHFTYPNFILQNGFGDTLAMEISSSHDSIVGGQIHTLDITQTFTLPIWTQLSLYTDSFRFFHCADQYRINDTVKSCDSLYLDSVVYHPTLNELDLYYDNRNSPTVLFDYPSFVLFDQQDDTIGVSKTFLFLMGIGPGRARFQLTKPLSLPFNGYIRFYSNFGEKLECTFPFRLNANGSLGGISPVASGVHIYPNPTKTVVKIELKEPKGTLKITDVHGRLIWRENTNENLHTIDVSSWSKGVYFIQYGSSPALRYRQKLLVN